MVIRANVEVQKMGQMSAFRKVALGTWQTAYDPSIYGTMRLPMEPALAYIEKFREKTGRKLTITHLVARAAAMVLEKCPEANALLRWNRIYLRKNVDVSVLVLMDDNGQIDLSSATLRNADKMTLVDVLNSIEKQAELIRAKKDPALEQTRQSMKLIPSLFINAFFKLLSFLLYTLNMDLSRFGLPRDPFGGCVVTSIGSLGLDVGYVPLVPYSRVPIFISPGAIKEEPVVRDGELAVAKVMNLSATFDHRIIDGGHAAVMSKTLRAIFENPFDYFDKLD